MQVTQEQISPCEIELQIELDAEELETAYEKTFNEAASKVTVPGFRKGRAPRALVEKYVDADKLLSAAADDIVRPAYVKAIEERNIEPFAPADVELVKLELGQPLVFKARVPLAPIVELGDYIGLEFERRIPEVTDEMVEQELQRFLKRHAEYPEVTDRAAERGDIAVVETRDESAEEPDSHRDVVRIGENLPEFDDALVGMRAGEEKVIDIRYPEDHASEELRGRTVPYRTTVVELREEKVPELTDEWVKRTFVGELPEGEEPPADLLDSVDKLRERIKSLIEREARNQAENALREEILQAVVEKATVHFPQAMVDERIAERFERLLSELKSRQVTLEEYLERTGRTFEELRSGIEESVRRSLRAALVVGEILSKHGLSVEESDIDEAIRSIAASRQTTAASVRALLERTGEMDKLRNNLLFEKAMDFLVHASNIKNVSVDAKAT